MYILSFRKWGPAMPPLLAYTAFRADKTVFVAFLHIPNQYILDLFRLDLIRMKTSMDLFLMKKEQHSN